MATALVRVWRLRDFTIPQHAACSRFVLFSRDAVPSSYLRALQRKDIDIGYFGSERVREGRKAVSMRRRCLSPAGGDSTDATLIRETCVHD